VWLPGGYPVFPEVPSRRREQVLADHGLAPSPTQLLDPARNLTLVSWKRALRPTSVARFGAVDDKL